MPSWAALEKTAAHHVVELALKRIEAADDTGNFVVEMILVPEPKKPFAANEQFQNWRRGVARTARHSAGWRSWHAS